MEGFYIAALEKAAGVGQAAVLALWDYFGSAAAAWQGMAELGAVPQLSAKQREALAGLYREEPLLPEKIAEECRKKDIAVCTRWDGDYPVILKEIFRPPLVLFYRGQLQADTLRVAVVGARKATPYGKSVAEALGAGLAKGGATVVSGAAYGIDAAAHKGALAAGRTVAVLGCGVDVAYPPSNRRLLEEIAAGPGAVVSEYAPGTKPVAAFFPARNRIISGLARGTVVVEAADRSGSLITAEMALSEGRDVFAVPGSIFSELSRGTNRLIQQGAKLVQSSDDVLSEYMEARPAPEEQASCPEMTAEEAAIYRVLSFDTPLPVDEIIYKLNGSNVSNIAFQLLQMELKGLITENDDHTYCRAVKEGQL